MRTAMNGLLAFVVLGVPLGADASAPIGASRCVLMGLSQASAPSTDAPAQLNTTDLLAALRLRLPTWPVEAVTTEHGQTTCWLVTVALSASGGELVVAVQTPQGESLSTFRVALQGRLGTDLARTVALMVVATLEPYFPENIGVFPAEGESTRSASAVSQALLRSAPEPLAAWHVRPEIAVGWRHWLPAGQEILGAELGLQRVREWLHTGVQMGIWRPVRVRGSDYRIDAQMVTLQGGVGVELAQRHSFGFAALGAELRYLKLAAHGRDVAFSGQSYANVGPCVSVGAGLTYQAVRLVLSGTYVRYLNRHPVAVVDGEPVLNTGHSAMGLRAGFSYTF